MIIFLHKCLTKMRKVQEFPYQLQLKQLCKQIKHQQEKIAILEEHYLQRTKNCGNIIKGFQYYLLQKTLLVLNKEEFIIGPGDRLFSLTSVTSEASKQYAQLIKRKKKLKATRGKSLSSIKKKIKDQKRSKLDYKGNKIQKINEETSGLDDEDYDQISIQSLYNREGSLHKRPCPFVNSSRVRSQDNLQNTLSDRSPVNSDTQSIKSFTTHTKRTMKKPEVSRSTKRWINKQKKKAQTPQTGQVDTPLSTLEYQEMDEIQGNYTLEQLKANKPQITAEQTKEQDEDLCTKMGINMKIR